MLVFIAVVLMISALIGAFAGSSLFFQIQNKKVKNTNSNAFIQTFHEMNYVSGEKPDGRSASDAFIIASHLLEQMDYYSINGIGNVSTNYGSIGSLKLWGHAEKKQNKIHTNILAYNQFFKSYRVGLKYDYDISTALIDFFWGETKADGTATWNEPEQITKNDYIEEWGMSPSNFFTYIISNKTALSNSGAVTFFESGKMFYKFSISLDPDTAATNYAKQLKKMSNSSTTPIFESIQFDFVLDSDFIFKTVSIKENYFASVAGLAVDCNSQIEYIFNYNIS